MAEDRHRTQIADDLWVKHMTTDGRLRGSIGAAGVDPIDMAHALQAIRDAVAELEARIVAIEDRLGAQG